MTTAEIQALLVELKKAYTAAASGASYTISDGGASRSYTRQDISKLSAEIDKWEKRLKRSTNGIQTKYIAQG